MLVVGWGGGQTMTEYLGPGGHRPFLHREVEPSPGVEGDGGGLQRVAMNIMYTSMMERCAYHRCWAKENTF